MSRCFKHIVGVSSGNYIYFWKSKDLPDGRLDSITASGLILLLHLTIKLIQN